MLSLVTPLLHRPVAMAMTLLPVQATLPGFAAVDKDFCKASMDLTRRVARLLSKVLGEPQSWLEGYIQDPFVALHNLHYAPIKSQPEKGILGLGKPLYTCRAVSCHA